MITLIDHGVFVKDDKIVEAGGFDAEDGRRNTITYGILNTHNVSARKDNALKIKFDSLCSHDITYVGIIQTAKASGLAAFPVPYVLTNCHNSLCAVGGTINEDDHVFGLSAAKKYGGIYVPPHLAVIHAYMREKMAKCGAMILGSDSHTRYGALGTMGVGEGGPELVKQILSKTYDIKYPKVVAVMLAGKVRDGVGPQDVALAIIGATFKSGFVNNKVLEFIGDGVDGLPIEFRNGIDVMTTETTCLSSIWKTDEKVKEYYKVHGREKDFCELKPTGTAYYDSAIVVDLETVEPMIALPFHPSNIYTIRELTANPHKILSKVEADGRKLLGSDDFKLTDKIMNGKIMVQQGIIAGCAGGTYDNLCEAANILRESSTGDGEFNLSIYPASQPVYDALVKNNAVSSFINSGCVVKTAFCGPCFGAGDVPAHNTLSIRHTTRNFEYREGSIPKNNQIASVALMDARSIAATAANGGILTSALDIKYDNAVKPFVFNGKIYEKRVYDGWGKPDVRASLKYGPGIADWPVMQLLKDNVILEVAAAIYDEVTTTDELIPSGETSSYRSNPYKLAEFTLSRKCPSYVARAKAVQKTKSQDYVRQITGAGLNLKGDVSVGSAIFAKKPGDGSAREQAASCQRVLGGLANIAREYATKRYRSNLINWGMLPFISDADFKEGDLVVVTGIKSKLRTGGNRFDATIVRNGKCNSITMSLDPLTEDELEIILEGCLINYYKNGGK